MNLLTFSTGVMLYWYKFKNVYLLFKESMLVLKQMYNIFRTIHFILNKVKEHSKNEVRMKKPDVPW